MKESRRKRESRIIETTAQVGFERGFVEGARYVLGQVTGLPIPVEVIVDDALEPGTSTLHIAPKGSLQEDRASNLGQVVQAVRMHDIQEAARRAMNQQREG